jgi:diguanylate cyclase (GGDEF)-like protein
MLLEWNRAVRDKSSLALIVFGAQSMEDYDTPEHDALMKVIAQTLENTIKRSTDFLARWNEDEFAVLLPITEKAGALIVADRILAELKKVEFPRANARKDMSVGGIVCVPVPNESPADFIENARKALLSARENIRGGIVFHR